MFLEDQSGQCENPQQVPREDNVSHALQLPQVQVEDIHRHRQKHFQLLHMPSQQNLLYCPGGKCGNAFQIRE